MIEGSKRTIFTYLRFTQISSKKYRDEISGLSPMDYKEEYHLPGAQTGEEQAK